MSGLATSRVRLTHYHRPPTEISTAPSYFLLLNLCSNDLVNGPSSISIGDVNISNLLFADDAVMLAESAQALHDDLCKNESWCGI